jgi:hypothetical protein
MQWWEGWEGGDNMMMRRLREREEILMRRLRKRTELGEEEVEQKLTWWWEGWKGGDNMMMIRLRRRR